MNRGDPPASAPNTLPLVDMHVHVVGNGLSGSGCWLRTGFWHRPLAALMLRNIGLRVPTTSPDFDQAYVERFSELADGSSLGALVILAHDQVHDSHGCVMEGVGSFHVPNEYVLQLAREHPRFLPAVSIHPARPDAMEELDRCLAGGAVLMKCLPNCHNIDCNDRRYVEFWERMAEAGLPLLAHTGGEHTVPVVRKELADPRTLRLPLECGVTVIAAHCGTKSGLFDQEYFGVFAEMLGKHPNLYGDTSAFSVPIRGRHVRECVREPVASRLMHGSDFPVPVQGIWAWLRGFLGWQDFRRCARISNVLERDFQLKRSLGFPPEHFTRIWRLLRHGGTKA